MTITEKQIEQSAAKIDNAKKKLAEMEANHRVLILEWKREKRLAQLEAEIESVKTVSAK